MTYKKKETDYAMKENPIQSSDPAYLKWHYKPHPDTGQPQLTNLSLSDDSEPSPKAICKALKSSSGTEDCEIGERILSKIASGLSSGTHQDRLNEASAMLAAFEPRNPTESLLFGQYLAFMIRE